jgi:hypothetical protein
MKLLLIVPDGVAVRNYLYSSFINELQANGFEIILYHQISNAAIEEVKKIQPFLSEIKSIPHFIEKPKARLLRESLAYARLLCNKKKLSNPTVMDFWNSNQKSLKQKFLYRLAEVLGTIFSWNYNLILKMEALYDKEISKDAVLSMINEDIQLLQPDYILNLHQRAPISAPIIAVAKKRKIKTATVIFSWDNVPKARLISRYDTYFVWSDVMKRELSTLYPEISKEHIKIVGTPQFEFYFQEELLKTKTDFFNEYGLNPTKKTICFSANDQTSLYEQNYLEDLGEELSKIEERVRPQVLFRKCPVDKSDRFDAVLEKYKSFMFSITPDWRVENNEKYSFVAIYPAYNDLQLLVNTVRHSDVVINFGSTMAHDFAVYQKPCLYLKYNPVLNPIYNVNEVYQFQHFKSMEDLQAVGWINQKSEMRSKIEQALQTPNEVAKDRKLWMERIVKYPLLECSKNLANEIQIICTSVS